jgi:hypothetical protein
VIIERLACLVTDRNKRAAVKTDKPTMSVSGLRTMKSAVNFMEQVYGSLGKDAVSWPLY